MGTVKKTAYTVVPTIITKTHTQTCSIPARQPWQDPWCNFTPTLVHAAALETSASATSSVAATTTDSGSSASRRRRADNVRRVPADRAQRVAERKARLASLAGLQERGLDVATTTVTDLNTADYATTTTTSTASTSTISVTAVIMTTVTSTTTNTVLSGTTTLKQVTITAVSQTYVSPLSSSSANLTVAYTNKDQHQIHSDHHHYYNRHQEANTYRYYHDCTRFQYESMHGQGWQAGRIDITFAYLPHIILILIWIYLVCDAYGAHSAALGGFGANMAKEKVRSWSWRIAYPRAYTIRDTGRYRLMLLT